MEKALNILVSGKLRKTGFRFYCMQKAIELGINGTVSYTENKNRIIIIAEGKEEKLKIFLKWCSSGTPFCRVAEIDAFEIELSNYSSFDIIKKEKQMYTSNY